MNSSTPYLKAIHAALPRVLALFDTNPFSPMQGVGDRYRWAWKGTDFTNGTFQSAVHGLALLWQHHLLPDEISRDHVLQRISTMIDGTRSITHRNGSLDEILPLESSYCVTALVAFDTLCALEVIKPALNDTRYQQHLGTVKPLIRFLTTHSESHGIITNHLAVAAAALTRWHTLTADKSALKARAKLMAVILRHRSTEGWFEEYNGADPGYQTLALDYLVDLDAQAPELKLRPLLEETCGFLIYCAHPDGSFGGLYGSRNTRFLYPAGITALAAHSSDAAALAAFASNAHAHHTVVGLSAMDDANLIPMFTSFCRAATSHVVPIEPATLPFAVSTHFQREFPEAGWIVTHNAVGYSIVNWKKSAVSFFSPNKNLLDGGSAARNSDGHWFTTQTAGDAAELVEANATSITIRAPMMQYRATYPSAFQMVILRLLCLTVMRLPLLNACIKKLLVRLLISRRTLSRAIVQRTVTLTPEFQMNDQWITNPDQLQLQTPPYLFSAIHMASQGYWQIGDDR